MKRLMAILGSWGVRALVLTATAILIPACGRSSSTSMPPAPYSILGASVSTGQVGTPYSQTLTVQSGTSPYAWSLLSGSLPPGLALGPSTGIISGTPTGSPSFSSFTVRVTDANSLVTSQVFSVTITGGAPAVLSVATTSPLPGGTQNSPYAVGLSAAGGTPPYTWAVTTGTLPAGLSLNSATGHITGTVAAAGTTPFTVTVTDSVAATAAKPLSLTINAPLAITTTILAGGSVGGAYNHSVLTSGGTAPVVWAVSGGALPTGLVINPATGAITGLPSAAGTFSFTVQAADAAGATASAALLITVNVAPTITTASLIPWTQNKSGYSQTLAGTGGTGAYTWSVSVGTLPAGLVLAPATGAITGTPTAAATSNFTVTVTDFAGGSGIMALSIVISLPVTVTPIVLQQWTINRAAYSQTVAATGGTGAHTWSVTTGTLPAGLTISAATGAITGTPSAAATSNFTVTATDTVGATGSLAVSIVINAAPLITTSTAPNWTQGFAFTALPITNTGGTAPLGWTTTGTLPTGMTLAVATGILSGTPSAAGTFNFSVVLTDAAGASTSQPLSIIIAVPLSVTTATPMAAWTQGKSGYSQTLAATGGTGVQTWSVSLGAVPAGLALVPATGAITGTPTASGTASFSVMVTDSVGATNVKAMTLLINAPLAVTSGVPLTPWTQGKSGYSQTLTATGGTGAQTWSVTLGSLPVGLTLAPATGAITGTPTAAGTSNFTVTVTDTVLATGSLAETIVINLPLSVTTGATLAAWTQNKSGYNQLLAATGGTGAQTWSNPGGGMPAGLGIVGAAITGTPSAAPGLYTFNLLVTDAVGATGTLNSASIQINPPVGISTGATLPDGSQGVSYPFTFTSTGGTGAIQWTLTGGTLPGGLTLSLGGSLSGTPGSGGSFGFTVTATDSVGASANKGMTLFILAPFAVSTSSLPGVTASTSYAATSALAATGGRSPYAWSIVSGTLPGSILFSPVGVWSGTAPATNGIANFTVRSTDADGRTADKALSITISGGTTGAITQSPLTLPGATQGSAYDRGISASGGTPGYTWTAVPVGASGLSLGTDGHVTGTPTTAGPYTFTSLVTDSLAVTNSVSISITVNSSLSVTTVSPIPGWTVGPSNSYNQTLTRSGGTGPFTWAINSGALPTGMSLNTNTGAITGVPTATGIFPFSVQVGDAAGAIATQPLQITINSGLTVTTPTPMAQWSQNFAGYSQTLAASGGSGGNTWSLTLGSLPTGLGPITSGGLISGTPTVMGTFNFTVQVTDLAGAIASKVMSITINSPPSVNNTSLPGGTIGAAYSGATLTGSGGTGTYTWAVSIGALPSGLVLNTGTGAISGTPNGSAGPSSFTVQLQDGVGAIATKALSITIVAGPLVANANPPTGSNGVGLGSNVVLTFNQAMNTALTQAAVTFGASSGPVPTAAFFWDGTSTVLTIVFETNGVAGIQADDLLTQNVTYTVTVGTGAQNLGGTPMASPYSTTFTTVLDGTSPTVSSYNPPITSLIPSGTTVLDVNFSKNMNQTQGQAQVQFGFNKTQFQGDIQTPGTNVGMSVSWPTATTFRLTFLAPLPDRTMFRLQVNNIQDAASPSHYFSSNGQVIFVTANAGADTTPPAVTGTIPPNGATLVARDTGMFVALTEPVQPSAINHVTVTGAPGVTFTKTLNDQPAGIQIGTDTALPAGTSITISWDAGLLDCKGNAITAGSITFTTAAADATVPTVDTQFCTFPMAPNNTDIDQFSLQGEIAIVKAGQRDFINMKTLSTKDVSVFDSAAPNIPVKGYTFNTRGNLAGLQFNTTPNFTGFQNSHTYVLRLNTTLQNTSGVALAQTDFPFTVVAPAVQGRPVFQDIRSKLTTQAGSVHKADLQVNFNGSSSGITINSFTAQDSPDTFNVPSGSWNPAPPTTSSNFQYQAGNEVNLSTAGLHTITYTAVDSNGHTMTVKDKGFIFASVPTCVSTSASTTPTYTWSSVPATAQALFLNVMQGSNTVYSAVMGPSATSFAQPADFPLTSGVLYTWSVTVIHFTDASLNGGDQQGSATPLGFTPP